MQKLRAFALSLSVQLDLIVQQMMLGSLQNVSCLTYTNTALSRVTLPVPWELFIMTIYICSVQEQPKEKGVQRLSAFGAKQSGNFTHSGAPGKSAGQHQWGIFPSIKTSEFVRTLSYTYLFIDLLSCSVINLCL